MSAAGVCIGGYDDVSVLKELVDAVERAAFVYLCLDFALSIAGGFGEAFTVTLALSRDSDAWMRASASRSRMGAMRIFPTVDFSIRSSVVLRSWRNREVSGNTLTPILLAIYIFLPIPGL